MPGWHRWGAAGDCDACAIVSVSCKDSFSEAGSAAQVSPVLHAPLCIHPAVQLHLLQCPWYMADLAVADVLIRHR